MTEHVHGIVQGVLLAVAALLPIVNPIGNAPLFLTLTCDGLAVVMRLSAFILLCIGVQILWNGVDALFGIRKPHS